MSIHTNKFCDKIQKKGCVFMYHYKRLRDLREDKDLKQSDIAKVLEDSQQHYQLYESGKREPPFWVIIKLAEFYNVSIDYIAGTTNDKGGMNKLKVDDLQMLKMFHQLNEKGKGRILERMQILLKGLE